MAVSKLSGIRVAGLACAVPASVRTVAETAAAGGVDLEEARKIAETTGVRQRHTASTLCTSDLCFAAAEQLIRDLGWQRESIDGLLVVTQTPDYILPATSCLLQHRLGLSRGCAAMDIGLGCSGYVYGLWTAAGLIAARAVNRVLLLVGDTITRCTSPRDRSVSFLFGDAGTATALERRDGAGEWAFSLGTDGAGRDHLIIPAGGARKPAAQAGLVRVPVEEGIARNELDLRMNGGEVFAFTLREVPPLIRGTLEAAGWDAATPAAFVFHQANAFMLQYLSKRLKLRPDRVPVILGDFGNTSSASIPLTLQQKLGPDLRSGDLKLLLAGFGVGFSWGAAAVGWGPMAVPGLVLVDEPS